MINWVGILKFSSFLIVALVMFYYFFFRIFTIFGIYKSWKQILLVTLFAILIIFVIWFLSRYFENMVTDILGDIVMVLLMMILFSILFLVVEHVVSFFYKINKWVFLAVFLWCFAWWIWNSYQTKFINLNFESDKITQDYKIAFISDIHTNSFRTDKFVQRTIEKIMSQNPDMILIAGDLVDDLKYDYVESLLPFNDLEIPVVAVLWNHDNWTHLNQKKLWEWEDPINTKNPDDLFWVEKLLYFLQTSKIQLLVNERLDIWEISLIWIEDKSSWSGVDSVSLLNWIDIDEGKYNIFMTHQPVSLEKISGFPINLEIAWHTHNWQFIPFSWGIGLFNDYKYWLYSKNEKNVFVSQWVGAWGFPFRFWTSSEIVIVDVVGRKKS